MGPLDNFPALIVATTSFHLSLGLAIVAAVARRLARRMAVNTLAATL